MKQFFSLLLIAAMVFSMLPVPAFAEELVVEETAAETQPEETLSPLETETPTMAPTETPTVPVETEVPETVPEETETEPAVQPQEGETEMIVPETEATEMSVAEEPQQGVYQVESGNNLTGTCGSNVTWSLEDGTLTISGSGKMKDYSSSSTAPWFSERLNIRSVVVESGVTSVGGYAFYYCTNLESVNLSDTVTSIGSGAFYNCTALTSAAIPVGVKYLNDSLFRGCTKLTDVYIPDTVTSVGPYVFADCTSLVTLDIPESVTSIGYNAFSGCTSLKHMEIPEGVKYIDDSLFWGCTGLETVIIPDSVYYIDYYAFSGCTSLKRVDLPASLETIKYQAFKGCSSLTEIVWPAGVSIIESSMFADCTSLQKVTLPEGLNQIYSGAFQNCTALTEIDIPKSVVSISDAFYGCTNLVSVSLKEGLVSLEGTFYACSSLPGIQIPETVTSIGNYTFYHCDALSEIVIPDTVTGIGKYAFSGCGNLTSVKLPAGLKVIEEEAFHNCDALTEIALPDALTSIGRAAFYDCDALTEIVIPDTVTGIGSSAFCGCDTLSRAFIPATVASINGSTFSNCPKLTEISFGHLSSGQLEIASDAFYLDRYNYSLNVPTVISVPYARDVHSAITGYDWKNYRRTVSYKSHSYLPVETIAIDTHPAEVEVGLEVAFTAQMEPWYCTSELIWEVRNDSGEAVIDRNGVLVAVAPGYVTVICKSSDDDNIRAESQIKILKATALVEAIDIRCDAENDAEVELGQQVQMIAEIFPGNAANKEVTWEVEEGSGKASLTEEGVLTGLECGTVTVYAFAADGSGVVGSRVIEVLRYVNDITLFINGREEISQVGVNETAVLTAAVSPENASYPNVTWELVNGTGEATLDNGRLKGISAGTVTIIARSQDSRKLTVSKEIEIVGEKAAFAVTGGNLYYNTVTGTIIGCDSTVTSANIPVSISGTRITGIAPRAFYNQDNLSSVTIPTPVTYIGDEAFYDCDMLTSLRFMGNGIATIGRNAFRYCEKLVNLALPESLVSIGEGAFYGLNGLKNLTVSGELDTSNWLSQNYNQPLESVTFTGTRIISQKVDEYGNGGYSVSDMPGRYARKVIIRDTVTEICDYAFTSCNDMEEVVIGDAVQSIGKAAFEGCTKLTRVVLPEGIVSLGENAFRRCRALTSINLPESLTHIGERCFSIEDDSRQPVQLIDLSGNPTKMQGRELQLTYSIPEVLVEATGGKNQMRWYLLRPEDGSSPYDVAHIDSRDGILIANGIGTVTVICQDEYTGAAGSWTIEVSSGIVLQSPGNQNRIVSGNTLQLEALVMPDMVKADVFWSIREQDKAYATITQTGKVTARTVSEAHQIEVTATPRNGAEPLTMQLWIVPKTTGLYIHDGNADITGHELDVDMAQIPSIQLTAYAMPEGTLNTVNWTSSNENVATVDDGLVTFHTPGTVTITVKAADGSGKSAKVKFLIVYRDDTKELTATLDIPDKTLESGQSTQMLVYGADPEIPMDRKMLQFTIPSSQHGIATVDENGLITAGETPGSVTVTASLKGDPLNRQVKVKITVIARQTQQLLLRPEAPAFAEVQMIDVDGYLTAEESKVISYTVLLKKADVLDGSLSFVIRPEATTSAGIQNPGRAGLKWATSNSKIATISVNDDGTAVVKIQRGAVGSCTICAVTTDLAKVENEMTIHIRDYSPRLETAKPTLNTYLTDAAVIGLVPSYGNEITDTVILEGGVVSERLVPVYEEGVLTITARQYIANTTLPLELRVTCADGVTYGYALTAKVKNTAPSITVKQLDKPNLFYTDSTVTLDLSVKNETVTDVDLVETDDFILVAYEPDTGEALLQFSEGYILDHSQKPDTKAALLVHLEGYPEPVKKAVTISTQNKRPTVYASPKTSTVNTALDDEWISAFGFVLKDRTQLLSLDNAVVNVTANFAESWVQDDQVILSLKEKSGGTATIQLQLENWMDPVKVTHTVKVSEAAPSLKFGNSTLKLNSIFTEQTDMTAATFSQSNLEIGGIRFVPVAASGTVARRESEKILLTYDPGTGMVVAKNADPEDAPVPGTYSFDAYATSLDGNEGKAVKLKVKVTASSPTVKLKNSTLSLNKVLFGEETAVSKVTLSSAERYSLVGFTYPADWDPDRVPVELAFENGYLTARLLDGDAEKKTHAIKICPIVLDEVTGQEITLPTTVSVKVKVYSSTNIQVSLSSKGKLDAINPDSEIRYTVSKITNACGAVESVTLEGADADLFSVCLNEDGTVSLKLLPGEEYSVKKNYKVQFCFLICGREVYSKVLSFKVTQSSLVFSILPVKPVLYQSQTMPLSVKLVLTKPVNATLQDVSLNSKSSQNFLAAMGDGKMDVTVTEDGRSAIVSFEVHDTSKLVSGKSYTLYLDVTAQGSAADAKATQLKLTVEVK